MEEMTTPEGLYNLYLILMGVRGILGLFFFFVIIRIIGFWMQISRQDNQVELLEEILKELKEKNKE